MAVVDPDELSKRSLTWAFDQDRNIRFSTIEGCQKQIFLSSNGKYFLAIPVYTGQYSNSVGYEMKYQPLGFGGPKYITHGGYGDSDLELRVDNEGEV